MTRLIDADALRNEVDTWGCNDYDKYDFLDAIDNAPTVELQSYVAKVTLSEEQLNEIVARVTEKALSERLLQEVEEV